MKENPDYFQDDVSMFLSDLKWMVGDQNEYEMWSILCQENRINLHQVPVELSNEWIPPILMLP